jgi:SAM-dependent methyltransferase
VIVSGRNPQRGDAVVKEITTDGGSARFVQADLADLDSLRRLAAQGGPLDVTRRADPRIAALIWDAVVPGRSLLNVGASTGSYEPADRNVVAVEPSPTMIAQRSGRSRLVVQGVAEHLPFPTQSLDAALAVLTVRYWTDREAGLAELRRVSRRQVVFFFEPLQTHQFWALEYFEAELSARRRA